jgi:hypothetical protein
MDTSLAYTNIIAAATDIRVNWAAISKIFFKIFSDCQPIAIRNALAIR